MAHKDDVTRVLAACDACGSIYAARQWPDGTVRIIGQEGCSCGEETFEVVTDPETDPPADADAE